MQNPVNVATLWTRYMLSIALSSFAVEARGQSTSFWLSAVSGEWSNASLWSSSPFAPNNGSPAGTTYHAVIDATGGPYTVMQSSSDITIDRLTLNSVDAFFTQHFNRRLNVLTSVEVLAGTLRIDGTLSTPIVNVAPSSVFSLYGGRLESVSVNGDMSCAGGRILGGLSVSGEVSFPFLNNNLIFDGSQSVSAGTFNLNQTFIKTNADETLTLGASTVWRGIGSIGQKNSASFNPQNRIINFGRISADVSGVPGGELLLEPQNLENRGTLEAVAGGTLTIKNVQFGGTLPTFNNLGLLRATSGSTVNLYGTLYLGQGTYDTSAGTVNIRGTVDNFGDTLTLNASTGSWRLASSGKIWGGTVETLDGTKLVVASRASALMQDVTVNGDIDVIGEAADPDTFLRVQNSLTLDGTLRIAGTRSMVVFGDTNAASAETHTLVSGTVLFDGDAGQTPRLDTGKRATLVLGPGTLVHGKRGTIGDDRSIGGTSLTNHVVNQGTVSADVAGERIDILADDLINQGVLEAKSGGTLNIGGVVPGDGSGLPRTWANTGTLRVNNGTLILGGTFSSIAPSSIDRTGGEIVLQGRLENTGSMLEFSSGSGSWSAAGGFINAGQPVGATIVGGTVRFLDGEQINIAPAAGYGPGLNMIGVTIDGAMRLTSTDSVLNIQSGLTLNNAISLESAGASILVHDNSTISGGMIELESSTGFATMVQGVGLTVGSTTVIRGGRGTVGGVINLGVISADRPGQPLSAGFGTNFGTLQAVTGGTLHVNGDWTNLGLLRVDNATLDLGGRFTSAGLGSVQRAGDSHVELSGIVLNTSSTLTVGGTLGSVRVNGGWINEGTIDVIAPDTLSFAGGGVISRLVNTQINGDVQLAEAGAKVHVNGSLGLTGTAHLSGAGAELRFENNNASLSSGTVAFEGTSGAYRRFYARGTNNDPRNIEIGVNAIVRGGRGVIGQTIEQDFVGVYSITNRGLISADVPGQKISIYVDNFTNLGTIEAINGGTIEFLDRLDPFPTLDGRERSFALQNSGNLSATGEASAFINGNLVQTSVGVLDATITAPASLPILQVSGSASIAGTIAVGLAEGFQPTWGDTFSILSAGALSISSAAISFPEIANPDLRWWSELQGNLLMVGVTHFADPDRSGAVDFGDITTVLASFGQSGDLLADSNRNGVVDYGDITSVLSKWGLTAEAVRAVPAPAACSMFALCFSLTSRRRRTFYCAQPR